MTFMVILCTNLKLIKSDNRRELMMNDFSIQGLYLVKAID